MLFWQPRLFWSAVTTITEELPTEPTSTEKPATTNLLTVPIPALAAGTTSAPTPTALAGPEPGGAGPYRHSHAATRPGAPAPRAHA